MARSFLSVTAGSGTKLATNNYTDGADSKHDEIVVLGEQHLATYSAVASMTTATAASHLLQIMAGTALRVRIHRIEYYLNTLATTAALGAISLFRLTSAGTGGGVGGASAFDPADPAAGAAVMQLPTAKGAEGAQIWTGSVRYIQTASASDGLVQPLLVWDFDQLRCKPVIVAAGGTNGIAIKQETAIAGALARISVLFTESPY